MNLKNTLFTLFALSLLSGCRFGNYVEPVKQSGDKLLTVTAQVHDLTTAVLYNDGTPMSHNDNTSLVGLPEMIKTSFTTLEEVYIPGNTHLPSYFISGYKTSFETKVDSHYNIIPDILASDVVKLYSNPNCQTQLQVDQVGLIDTTNKVTYTDSSGATKQTDGNLVLDFTVFRAIAGDCLADLKTLAQCYQNHANCANDNELASAVALFDLYVNYGGVLALDDATLTKIKALAYVVHFE